MNIVIIGDCRVGKTSFVNRLVYGRFTDSYSTTIGKDLHYYDHNDQKLILHDCSGLDRYYSLIKIYFDSAHAFIIIYNDSTKQKIDKWLGLIPKDSIYVLVKNGGEKDDTCDILIDCKKNINIQEPILSLEPRIPKNEEEQYTFYSLIIDYLLSFLKI